MYLKLCSLFVLVYSNESFGARCMIRDNRLMCFILVFIFKVDDSVVAQNMHETLLEAMKALSEEFRQRSKSQSNSGPGGGATASNPISVPSRRHHPNPPPSQVGFTRRARTEPPGGVNGGTGVSSASASPTPRHSFPRSRTASDGGKVEEGVAGSVPLPGLSSSPSTNGSCTTTPILRSKSARSAPSTAAKTSLGLMRSISTPAPSPAPSLSSSSGHGSDFGGVATSVGPGPGAGTYSRVPTHRASVSGSPSDYGSSDEYGSSPGENTLLASPSLPGSSVGSVGSQSLGDEGANYILMGQHSAGGSSSANQGSVTSSSLPAPGTPACVSQSQTRRVLRRSSSRECETERRLLSKRASLPPMALERLAPRQPRSEEPADEDSADYAIMSRSTSRESFASTSSAQREVVMGAVSAGGGGGGYLDVAGEFKGEGGAGAGGSVDLGVDNGYMSMLPGVTQPPVSRSLAVSVPESESKPTDDYMAMTPNNSVSPPQQIRPAPMSDGYMIMSPNSSCSPDQRGGLSGGAWVGSGSADSRAGSDYMNMSPISARSVNGSPPTSDHSSHLETSSQQQAPKMVYSYYSLPRSYKHNSAARHFDEPGRGRRASGSGGRGVSGGRTLGGRQEQPATSNSVVGRHLSLSSSSYSSSSASSESLGESEDRATQAVSSTAAGAQSKDAAKLQQRGGSGALSKHGNHTRSRPVSLFVDVSKANTLPRVRENPLPPEPKSPGEYVSIEFKGDKSSQTGFGGGRGRGLRHGLSMPLSSSSQQSPHRPTSCLGNFIPLSRSPSAPITPPAASEYVNMDLGPSPSPSPLSLTSLVFPSFHTPPTPPTLALAPKACDEETPAPHGEAADLADLAPRRKSREVAPSVTESESPTSCGDYTEMAFSLTSNTAPRSSSSVSPKAPSPTRTDSSVPSRGLDFPLTKQGLNPDHGAKVIRADPQGRRRHCSETFLATPSLPTSSSTSSSSTASLFPEHAQAVARRLGFENMQWRNGAVTDTAAQFPLPGQQVLSTGSQMSSTEQGLNYIDLDLANKESPHLGLDGPSGNQAPSRLFCGGSGVLGAGAAVGSSSNSSLNTYASIDFYKSEELRTHQNGNKEGTGKKCLLCNISCS